MMSSKRKRTYLTIIAVGALAALVDRFLLSEGATDPEFAVADVERHAPDPTVSQDQNAIPELPFPRNLTGYTAADPMRDLFLPPVVEADNDDLPIDPTSDIASSDKQDTEPFESRHTLGGVLVQQGLKIAVVDGRLVHPGDEVDGCTLVTLTADGAHFSCPDGMVILRAGTTANDPPD